MFPGGQNHPWWTATAIMLTSYTTMERVQKYKNYAGALPTDYSDFISFSINILFPSEDPVQDTVLYLIRGVF